MPLIRPNVEDFIQLDHSVDPDITEGEWYRIKKIINWQEDADLNSVRGIKMKMPFGKVGKINNVDDVEVELDSRELNLAKIQTFLLAWSHEPRISQGTISHLDSKTARALLRAINKQLAEIRGVKEGDPLLNASDSL